MSFTSFLGWLVFSAWNLTCKLIAYCLPDRVLRWAIVRYLERAKAKSGEKAFFRGK